MVVGCKFKKTLQIYWAATSAALVSGPSGEDNVAMDNQPPSKPNPVWHVAEPLHSIDVLSKCLYRIFFSRASHF